MTYTTTKSKSVGIQAPLTFRPGTVADSYAVFRVFEETLADLNQRFGSTTPTSWQDPTALERMWAERRPLYEHLAQTAELFWVAEQDDQFANYIVSSPPFFL